MNTKITLFITNLSIGGAERVLVNMANEMVLQGYEVDVVLIQAKGPLLSELSDQVNIIDFNSSRIMKSLPSLIKYLRKQEPYALIAFMWPLTIISVLANMLAGREQKTKILVTEHCSWSTMPKKNQLFQWLMKKSMQLFYPYASAVVTVSEGAKQDFQDFSGLNPVQINLKAIYNPIIGSKISIKNVEEFSCPAWSEGSHQKILAVGNLKAIKDYFTLIKAFKILSYAKDVKLLILGEGEMRPKLEKLIKNLGLEERCFLLGQVSNSEVFYQQASLFVLSSIGEGLPTVLVEALFHGVPIVSTDCPNGPAEILLNGQYGKLVPVGDIEQMAFAMMNALNGLKDESQLKTRAMDFSIAKSVNEYLRLLEQT